MSDLLAELPSLGIAGLLFVMWWLERQDRARGTADLRSTLEHAGRIAEVNQSLLDVIRANTEALAALREELRAHRGNETEWLARLTQQLAELARRPAQAA